MICKICGKECKSSICNSCRKKAWELILDAKRLMDNNGKIYDLSEIKAKMDRMGIYLDNGILRVR